MSIGRHLGFDVRDFVMASLLVSRLAFDPGPTIENLGWRRAVAETNKQWKIRCECGYDFCDWKDNWKLQARIHVRDTPQKLEEIYPRLMAPTASWQVLREYYCPQCGTPHDVEAPTPWYPVIRDFEPDIDTFYKDWLGLPVPERADA
jgi:acetone carboxylase gamma subunit